MFGRRLSVFLFVCLLSRGATTAEKLRVTKVCVPTPSACAPRPVKGRAGCWVWDEVTPSRCEGLGVLPRNIYENSDAESCSLVITCCEIFLLWLFENYGQEVRGTNTLLVPNLKVGGPVSPGPYSCCAYVVSNFT